MLLSDILGMGLCFHKCFEVCKTLSHPFLSLNLRAVQQINQGDKITEPPSTGIGPPTFPECLRESGMVDLGPRIPTPLLFLPCHFHFTLSMFSLPRHPKEFLPLLFRETWAIFTCSAALLFFGELPLLYFCWYWCHCHREMGSASPNLGQNLSCHTAYLELVTHIWKLRDYRFPSIHPKGRVDLFLLLRSANIWCCPS